MFLDTDNLHVLYAEHARELGSFARRRVGTEEAADVVQDTYLRVLQYADQGALENPRAYLYRIAANVSSDRGGALKDSCERFDQEADLDAFQSASPAPDAIAAARQRLQLCISALESLPAVTRHVFLLHRIDGMTQAEISAALNIPRRTVERYIAKALEHCLKRAG